MLAGLKRRVAKLEGPRLPEGPCPLGPTCLVGEGEAVPPDAARCPRCGAVHVLELVTVVLRAPDDDSPPASGEAGYPPAPGAAP